MNVKTGEQILECTLNGVFTKRENNNFVYYVRINNTETPLSEFMELSNTIVVNVPQNNEQKEEEQQENQENQENEQQNEEEQQQENEENEQENEQE